jgi:hypothetical protein
MLVRADAMKVGISFNLLDEPTVAIAVPALAGLASWLQPTLGQAVSGHL